MDNIQKRVRILEVYASVSLLVFGVLALSAFTPTKQKFDEISVERLNFVETSVGSEEWYLRTEDKAAELYVREVGQGDPVIVLHGGWGSEHSYLLNAIKGLETQFRFIFYDQRGSLRSPCKLEFISQEKHVQDLETLRKELKLEKVTIVAHSMGTRLAMFYLQKYPDRVKTLV